MKAPEKIEVPAPSAWPVVMAFGMTLLCAQILLQLIVPIAGASRR